MTKLGENNIVDGIVERGCLSAMIHIRVMRLSVYIIFEEKSLKMWNLVIAFVLERL